MEPQLLDHALEYARRRWLIYPVWSVIPDGDGRWICACPKGSRCESAGKHPRPLPGFMHGFKDATEEEPKIREWLSNHPDSNIGLATGLGSGVVVLDIDPRNGGAQRLVDLQLKHEQLPATVTALTGGGGQHFFFRYPGGKLRSANLGGGVELKADNACVTLPPSLHVSGRRYAWAPDHAPEEIEFAVLPSWVGEEKQRPNESLSGNGRPIIEAGSRHDSLVRFAGNLRRMGFSPEAIEAALVVTNRERCNPPLPEFEVASIARSAAHWQPGGSVQVNAEPEGQCEWTQEELLAAEFPEQQWLVDGLVAKGSFTGWGGKKKLGKSFQLLQMVQAVAYGTEFLGRKTQQGSVLFLALEDGARRLKDRLAKVKAPPCLGITYRTRLQPLDGPEGLSFLRGLLDKHRPDLVIIDTIAACKTGKTDENAAGPMADLMNGLRRLAQDFECAIVAALHHGKHVSGNPGDDFRGSSATAGAADVNIGLYRDQGRYILRGEGRDISEFEQRVEWDRADTWKWLLVGDENEISAKEAQGEIVAAVGRLGEADCNAIAAELGKSRQAVQKHLPALRASGRLAYRRAPGRKLLYRPPGTAEGAGRQPALEVQNRVAVVADVAAVAAATNS
jgi:hypothetical protein